VWSAAPVVTHEPISLSQRTDQFCECFALKAEQGINPYLARPRASSGLPPAQHLGSNLFVYPESSALTAQRKGIYIYAVCVCVKPYIDLNVIVYIVSESHQVYKAFSCSGRGYTFGMRAQCSLAKETARLDFLSHLHLIMEMQISYKEHAKLLSRVECFAIEFH
jgi:hypothetical protein